MHGRLKTGQILSRSVSGRQCRSLSWSRSSPRAAVRMPPRSSRSSVNQLPHGSGMAVILVVDLRPSAPASRESYFEWTTRAAAQGSVLAEPFLRRIRPRHEGGQGPCDHPVER